MMLHHGLVLPFARYSDSNWHILIAAEDSTRAAAATIWYYQLTNGSLGRANVSQQLHVNLAYPESPLYGSWGHETDFKGPPVDLDSEPGRIWIVTDRPGISNMPFEVQQDRSDLIGLARQDFEAREDAGIVAWVSDVWYPPEPAQRHSVAPSVSIARAPLPDGGHVYLIELTKKYAGQPPGQFCGVSAYNGWFVEKRGAIRLAAANAYLVDCGWKSYAGYAPISVLALDRRVFVIGYVLGYEGGCPTILEVQPAGRVESVIELAC